MSQFRFNFSSETNAPTESLTDTKNTEENEDNILWFESAEVKPGKSPVLNPDAHAKILVFDDDIEICHINSGDVLKNMQESFSHAVYSKNNHSDLVKGKYEGGLKIWECTHDLIKYLITNTSNIILENTNVLDLGCGSGILGIYTFIKGASVTFQDYNKEVIECITMPNVYLNIENEEEKHLKVEKCKFFCGDWHSFNILLDETEMYDTILTSETIYNENNYKKLIDIFTKRLTANGTVYLAAKTYYFGVGGGTRQFEKALEKNGLFKSEVCWQSSGGIQREILKITKIS